MQLRRSAWFSLAVLIGGVLVPRVGDAHGIQGHMHVTAWAIENLPPGDLRDFFADPVVMNAAIFGAAYTDSGYWPQSGDLATRSRAYGEHTHWEPYVQDFVEWIVANDPPPWDSVESRQRVAFLMGNAAHGLQDEVFDSLFLDQVAEHDAGSQENADPGTDAMLAIEGHLRFVPTPYIPMETVLELYEVLDQEIDADTIETAVNTMVGLYVNERGADVAESFGGQYVSELPWTQAHYLDPSIPGSLRSEIVPTARYMQAIWDRLHSNYGDDALLVHTYPEGGRRVLGAAAGSPDSWITFVFGEGVEMSTVQMSLGSTAGVPHPFTSRGTRWGGDAGITRLVRFVPDADLEPGAWYEAQVAAGVLTVSGRTTTAPMTRTVQAECDAASPELCPPWEAPYVPSITGDGAGMPEQPVLVDTPIEASGAGSGAGAGSGDGSGAGSGSGDGVAADDASSPGGCGAAHTAGFAPGLLWLAGLAAVRRRRRG